MLKENILELHKKTVLYVNLVVLNEKLINLLKTNDSFLNLVSNLLTIIELIETDESFDIKEKNAESLKIAFETITNSKFELNQKISLSNFDECEEIVNYFPKFVLNTLKISIDELESETKKGNTAPQSEEATFVETEVISNSNNESTFESKDNNKNENKSFDSEKFINNAGFNMNDIADSMIGQYAVNILNSKIRTGQVYVFDAKPKIIPILKYICSFLFFAFLVLSITTFSLLASINGKIISYANINSSWEKIQYSTIYFPFQLILSILIVIMIITSLIKNNKNDNVKYRFSWGWIAFYVGISIFSALLELGQSFLIENNFTNWKLEVTNGIVNNPTLDQAAKDSLIAQNKNYFNVIDKYRYVEFSVYGILGAIVIVIAISAIFNPKRDVNRIQQLVSQYIDDIKSGKIDITSQDTSSGFMNRFGNGFF